MLLETKQGLLSMQVGDIVKYGKWYSSKPGDFGIIVEGDAPFFLVFWDGREPEWEDICELEVVSSANR